MTMMRDYLAELLPRPDDDSDEEIDTPGQSVLVHSPAIPRPILPPFPTEILAVVGVAQVQGPSSFNKLQRLACSTIIDKTPAVARILNTLLVLRRPAGFGKTTLLDMVVQYHDIHEANGHAQLFEGTLIGRNINTEEWSKCPRPNQRLALTFDLACVDRNNVEESLREYLISQLRSFLQKYKHELAICDEDMVKALEDDLDGTFYASMGIQYILNRGLFQSIELEKNSIIDSGLVVGEDILFPSEYTPDPYNYIWDFEWWLPEGTIDATHFESTQDTAGLSQDDIKALANEYLGSFPLDLFDEVNKHCKPQQYSESGCTIYSFERVFAVLQRRKSGASELAPDPSINHLPPRVSYDRERRLPRPGLMPGKIEDFFIRPGQNVESTVEDDLPPTSADTPVDDSEPIVIKNPKIPESMMEYYTRKFWEEMFGDR
ncbi:hypothetical protein AX16_005052 [Volvariella volvacea WC 439]|nr:hypothetical protein AX16_005052 [Volvariella volvacea WC 439]